ncbi:hypothetical protein DE146DRAFT_786093 [Phaeosphaeria sp. MPI-PUGE-AT-0046c]|nr:hypothetical protein DE146DRAFT_786093 [Phaeosphaeria sp. MPI-PUGE-AT-0046c]
MDPQSVAFQPRDDIWRFQDEMLRVQQNQAELSDRVSRLERHRDDDSRLKNVWGTSSPFPSVLGGTPQQVPLQQPTAEHFSNFDDHSSNLIGNLQLDADEEPRRVGATSRANSVRFDETANHGHWAHASRSSLDLIPRTGSGLGGFAMSERSYSHKSDGRQSSAGHSVHSMTSGRANSLTGLGPSALMEPPGLAPGLFILGSVPAIIRCWLDTNFKHDTLMYAAVSSGSFTSAIDRELVEQLGLQDHITQTEEGVDKIKIPVYLPEAVPVTSSSRSNSPAPQLPSIVVDFTINEGCDTTGDPKAIQVFLGSDTLRAHNADLMFSSNHLVLYDDERCKLRIPLVRPENERTFRSLAVISRTLGRIKHRSNRDNGDTTAAAYEAPHTQPTHDTASAEAVDPSGRSFEPRPRLGVSTASQAPSKDVQDSSPTGNTPRSGPSPAMLSNWRRESTEKTNTGSLDWANVGKTASSSTNYKPRDTGMKVLRPTRANTRTLPTSTSTSSPATSQSRFFDDGKRKVEDETAQGKRTVSGERAPENVPPPKPRSANPVGGASAFAWLNSEQADARFTAIHSFPAAIAREPHCPPPASHFPRPQPALFSAAQARYAPALYSSPSVLSWSSTGLHGRPTTLTTASTLPTKKRKTSTAPTEPPSEAARGHSPHEEPVAPRSSPHVSASIRYLPPHLHDEVLTDADAGHSSRDYSTGASSPSEAYAGLTLGDADMADDGTPQPDPTQQQPQPQRRAPRSSSPAKRLHSDMADDTMDIDTQADTTRRNSGQSSPRNTKPLPAGSSQRSARGTSLEMADAPNNSGSSETDVSNAADSSTTSMDPAQPAELPSLDEQVAKVMEMMSTGLQERQEGYIISEKWLERVWARTSENSGRPQEFSKEATQGPIGPVDNAGLVDADAVREDLLDQNGEDFLPLNKAAQMGQDFEILPAKAWELVVSWYGLKPGSPVIRRYAQNTVPDKSSENLEYELFPPIITVRKVRKAPLATESSRRAGKIVASRYESYLALIESAKKSASIDLKNKVRVWRILDSASSDVPQQQQTQPSGMLTPDASPRDGSPAVPAANQPVPLIMDVTSFNGLIDGTERELVTGKDEKSNEESNHHLTLAGAGLTQDQTIVLEEHDDSGEYISDKLISKNKTATQSSKGLQSGANSGRNTPTGSALTRSKARNGKVRGHVGLTNLGNTCYMNSALQCLRSVEELSMFFLSGSWKKDINASNPIGHGGSIAKVYAGLLNSIYDIGAVSSFSPKNFKMTLGKANNLFSGYGQQDSQEFVSWLVDALHEDLNRVLQKPYTENPDSDDNTHKDPEAIKQLGETYRNNHKARNDSVSMDLFSGFYKNTMVCPECEKVSITFDPYSQLTLQLPIEQTWTHTVTFVPLSGSPFQLEIDMDKNATIKQLKEYVGKRRGNIPASRLMASEVYSHKYYRHLDDKNTIAEANIGVRDDIFVYELDLAPSNWPAPKKKGSRYKYMMSQASSDEDIPDTASPLHDRVIIPVFSRGPNMSTYRSQNYSMALWPFFIVLSRDEARDNDAILRKLLAKVAQMTTRPILSELGDSPLNQSRSGSDVVLTTEEDASPNGDPSVQDGSIEGEDMVEVTMTDPAEGGAQQPSVLRPGSFIKPEFRQLFEIKHTKRSSEFVTTGWSTVDTQRALEPISKRIRLPPSREQSTQSSAAGSETSSSDEDADTPPVDADATMEAANVSSDEDMKSAEPESQSFSRGGRHNKKKNKKMRKQERKHKNNKNFKSKKSKIPEQPNYPDDPDDETDDRLVRMGEALVLEWDPNAYDALFGGTSSDDARGMEAMKFTETLDDPEIQDKKARRAARRKNGITLAECFTETSKSEVLSEDNAWYCNKCKELRRATKTLEIWTVPDILIIHLKRFSGHRNLRDKIEELIDFPVTGLDLSGTVGFPEGKDLTYDLFAVDNHYGGLGGGHYTAYAQNFYDKQWYDYNDSVVSSCSSGQKVVTRNAYLLFYRRRTPVPLGPPKLQKIVQAAESGEAADCDAENNDDMESSRSRARNSDSGNGQRLDASSRNGSSSAFTVGTGAAARAAALHGGGLHQPSAHASPQKSAAGVVNLSDDEADGTLGTLDGSNDEGFVDADDSYSQDLIQYSNPYEESGPTWSFGALGTASSDRMHADDSSGVASDQPELGSTGDENLQSRMRDFEDDDQGDDEVHEIRVPGE